MKSNEPESIKYLESIDNSKIEIRCLPGKNEVFSHSYLVNQSVNLCDEEYLLFLK